MRDKPDAIEHMLAWGLVSGIILPILYLIFVSGLDMSLSNDIRYLFANAPALIFVLVLMFGFLPSLILSVIDGIVLKVLTRKLHLPFTKEEMTAYRFPVYLWMGGITGFVSFSIFGFWGSLDFTSRLLLLLVPSIATITAIYAGHRYLFRLRLWSEKHYGIRKEKEKRDTSHLEENFSKDVDFEDEEMSHEDSLKR